jgi:hypothetical protein
VAVAIRFVPTTSGFGQRLVFERLMALHVPLSARRDLPRPAYLHLDLGERFPRVTVKSGGSDRSGLFGPFRDRRAADRSREALHKVIRLRPCDYTFEPDPALGLGLGCLYAQVRTCAAPCLARVDEDGYRAIAREAAALLAGSKGRTDEIASWLPAWVGPVAGRRGLVVEQTNAGVELYPVLEQTALDAESLTTAAHSIEAALEGLRWERPEPRPEDAPWLSAWFHTPRRSGVFVPVDPAESPASLGQRIRQELGP